ncbi:MAG: hypothetical protein A2W25_15005 [candidate division Zixibacteria bacterium RBG_16_53_22]|nr:MAG: hypothetical protein A2W25_15005 [candidate division Zixibacteria bacterium RBG_16_53_22]
MPGRDNSTLPTPKPKVRPVKLIAGVLFQRNIALPHVETCLIDAFGPIDSMSPTFDFTFTDYYLSEMGSNLKKRFYSFERLVSPDTLADIKHATIAIEAGFAGPDGRTVNVDPGYLEESKLVLASTKNFSHRIYLRDNIWAEVTMRYMRGKFVTHDWTYPDYSQPLAIDFLCRVREIYRKQLAFFDAVE